MKIILTPLVLLYLTLMCSCFKYQNEKADLIVHNAKIYTVDNSFSIAEAMAISEGKIIAIGPENEIRNKYYSENTVDAMKKAVFPGFIDAHSHFMMYAKSLGEVNLEGSKSWDEVLERTLEFQNKHNKKWILGRGWDQNLWDLKVFPSNRQLDSLFPNTPVVLWRIDAHAAIASSKALELAGVNAETSVKGGKIELKDGKATGLLLDMAIEKVGNVIPPLSKDSWHNLIKQAADSCFYYGLTSVSEAMMEAEHVNILQQLESEGKLGIKLYGMLTPSEKNKSKFLNEGPYNGTYLHLSAFKYFADGALGSRGARLKNDYSDDPGNKGLYINDSSYLHTEALLMYESGFQMATHCIGDAANSTVLDIYAEVLQGTNDRRWRIEHAQVVSQDDLHKFGDYNVIPSVQPAHAISDMAWASSRLGEGRLKDAYRLSELLDQNGLIALGTDFPIESLNPIRTFHAAVFRKNKAGEPEEGFMAESALTREEAIRGMTIWAAIANFEENEKGSLEPGKAADFTILNQDLMQVNMEDVLNTQIVATYINGKKVYKKN